MLKLFSGKPFGGVVVKYFPRRKLYGIKYKDGDEEELDESELALIIVGGMASGGKKGKVVPKGMGEKGGKVGKERKEGKVGEGGMGGKGKGHADKGVGKGGAARQGSHTVRQRRMNR